MLELNTKKISQSYSDSNGKHKNIIRMSCDSEYPIEAMNLKINFEDSQAEERRHYFIMKKVFDPEKDREFSYFSPKFRNMYDSNIQMKSKVIQQNKINPYNNKNCPKKKNNLYQNKNDNQCMNKYIEEPKMNSKQYTIRRIEGNENYGIKIKERPYMLHRSMEDQRNLQKNINRLYNDQFISDRNLFDESRRAHNQEDQMSFIQDEEDLSKFHFWGCNRNKGQSSATGLKNLAKNKGTYNNRKQNLLFKAFAKNPYQTSSVSQFGKNNYLFQNPESKTPRALFKEIQEHSNNDFTPKNDYLELGRYSSVADVTNHDLEFVKQTDYEAGNELKHIEHNENPDEGKGAILHNKKNPRGKVIENLKFILSKVSDDHSKNVETEDKYRNSPDVKNYDYNYEVLTENNDKEVDVEYQNEESPEDYDHEHYDFQQNTGMELTTEKYSKNEQRNFINELPMYHQRRKQKRFPRNHSREVEETILDKYNEYDESCNGGVIQYHKPPKRLNKIVTSHKRDTIQASKNGLANQKNVFKNETKFFLGTEKYSVEGQMKNSTAIQGQLLNAEINKDKSVNNAPSLGEIFLPKRYEHVYRNIL